MKQRLPAFTIMELTIALLITAIVTAMAYTCFTIVHTSFLDLQQRQQRSVEVSQLQTVLDRDLDRGLLLRRSEQGLTVSDSLAEVNYIFTVDKVLRITAAATDTFKVATKELACYFEGRPLNGQQHDTEADRTDEVSFTISYGEGKIPYHYVKRYSSQDLIRRNDHARDRY